LSNSSLLAPLSRRPFRHLAIGYAVNELGDGLGVIALSVLVFEMTGSALATTALFLGVGVAPALLTPLLIIRLERPSPRLVLVGLYLVEALVFGGLALLAVRFSLAAIVVLATVDAALAVTARSITRGTVAVMLEPTGELRAGNAVLNVAFTIGAAVGPAIAGLVVAGLGVQTALFLDAASFCLIALIVLAAGRLPAVEVEPGRLLEQVRAGLTYIRENVVLGRLVAAEATVLIFFTLVTPIEVIYAKQSLGAGDAGYGLFLAAWGAGMVLGSGAFATMRGASLPSLLFVSTLAIGCSYLGIAAAQSLAIACVAAVFGGVGNGVQWVAAISAVQELTASSMQVRTIGTLESLARSSPAIGYLIGGVLASLWDPRLTFVVAGLGTFAVVAVAAPLLGGRWPDGGKRREIVPLDESNDVVLELLPGGMPTSSSSEVEF
jgi:MFS family permease